MKKFSTGMVMAGLFALAGCASSPVPVSQGDLLHETWMHSVRLDTGSWAKGADSWYLTGEPNHIEKDNQKAAQSEAISTMVVHSPDFTEVSVSGDFQVQLVGRQAHNKVFIMGPNSALRDVVVDVNPHRLSIHAAKESKSSLKSIIVRINIHDLQLLQNSGDGNVYGREVLSDGLRIRSDGKGNVFLFGDMNVKRLEQNGQGDIVILGANSAQLDIHASGAGNVNINGHVGLHYIAHDGSGTVRVLGADTDSLTIDASGNGYTSVVGHVNLKKVVAADASQVYVYWLKSHDLSVSGTGSARIGLAGVTDNMKVNMTDSSRLEGQYLRAESAYVQTAKKSHVNVQAKKKIVTMASDVSSIYLFGHPAFVSRYTRQIGTIIPILTAPISIDAPQKDPSIFSLQ